MGVSKRAASAALLFVAAAIGGPLASPAGAGAPPVSVSVGDVSIVEGHARTRIVRMPVWLSAASASPVTVEYRLVEGTATRNDYKRPRAADTTITFAPGETQLFVDVKVKSGGRVEGDESFTFEVFDATGATVADGTGSVTIIDDDPKTTPLPRVGVGSVSAAEAPVDLVITLSRPAPVAGDVFVEITNGSAFLLGIVNFPRGATSAVLAAGPLPPGVYDVHAASLTPAFDPPTQSGTLSVFR